MCHLLPMSWSTCANVSPRIASSLYPHTLPPKSRPVDASCGGPAQVLSPQVVRKLPRTCILSSTSATIRTVACGMFGSAAAFGQSSSTTGGMIGTGALFGQQPATGGAFGASQPASGGFFGTPQSAATSGLSLTLPCITADLQSYFAIILHGNCRR